jgi:hypothetical protein
VSLVNSQNATVTWGTTSLNVTGINLSFSASEIDITSMYSRVVQDADNSGRKFVIKDNDVYSREAEISCEFFAGTSGISVGLIGYQRNLLIQFPSENGRGVAFEWSDWAILSKLSFAASVGDFVRGSATFLVTGL